MNTLRHLAPLFVALALMTLSVEAQVIQRDGEEGLSTGHAAVHVRDAGVEQPGLGHKLLWYVPNRLADVVDIFRFRVRVGLGGAVHARATRDLSIFAGSYNSLWLGLPGPRREPDMRPFCGHEALKGLIIVGVDATDDTPYHPDYSVSETVAGVHLGVAGVEAGFDLVEVIDLLGGLILLNPVGDDF